MNRFTPQNLEIDCMRERGNVLFIILLAVALFAALAYAVTQSTRSTGGDASKEQTVLLASQLTQYGTEIQIAITRIKISNGCTDEQISFENNIISGYINPNAPANYSCHVFRPEGGNVTFKNPPKSANDESPWLFTGEGCIAQVGTDGPSACYNTLSSYDMFMILPNVSIDVCLSINTSLGITNPSGHPPINEAGMPFTSSAKWTGSYTSNLANIIGGGAGESSNLNRKQSGCLRSPFTVNYHFYHVLIPR